jgi:hypothetical protein
MHRHCQVSILVVTIIATASFACSRRTRARHEPIPQPLFTSENPQSIYAADPNDSWNRIFRALFTRTVKVRIGSDLKQGAPFVPFRVQMGPFDLRISRDAVSRTEIGDRAIEPLYPSFLTTDGVLQVFAEPQFSELRAALRDAIEEDKSRSPVERALMQSDVWAAYDILYTLGQGRRRNPTLAGRKSELLELLRAFVRKLALTADQIKSLNNNYVTAVNAGRLPDIFSPENGWLEIELLPQRLHDEAGDYRRAARVFVKPRSTPSAPGEWVESLKHHQHLDEIEAVSLVVQNLFIDTTGNVVASSLFSDIQFRFFVRDPVTGSLSARPQQLELSRKKLLTEPSSGGLIKFEPQTPAYLTAAGNDYTFAMPIDDAGTPVLVPLRTRCTQCHGEALTTIMTYAIHDFVPLPTVKLLKSSDQEHVRYVAQRKTEREDFKSLVSPNPQAR